MAERILFKGVKATAGICRGCTKILIVTDKDATGAFQTYHEDPMCEWYLKECEGTEPTGPDVATHENIVFLK